MPTIKYRLPRIDFVSVRTIFGRFQSYLAPHRGRLFTSALALMGASVATLLQPWPLKVVFDYVLFPAASGVKAQSAVIPSSWSSDVLLWGSALSILALAAIKGLCTYTHNVQSRIVGHNLVAELRLHLFAHVQRLPQSYHDYRETGELMTRLTGDLNLVKDMLVSTAIVLSSHLFLILGMLVVMFFIDPLLALIALAVIPIFSIAAFRFSNKIKSSARKQREAYGRIVSTVQESLSGISQVRGFGQEKRQEKKIGKSVARDVQANVRTTKLTENYARTVELISAAGMCVVLLLGSYRALAGDISAGDVLIVVSYLRSMYRPLRGVARLTARMAKATVRGEKIIELMDMTPEAHDVADAASASRITGDIAFEDVTFNYVDGSTGLRSVSFEIPAGKTTLIVGPTGAGKSTIGKLLLRLYDQESGVVRMDGRDLREYRIASLRKRITPLTQEAFLFRTSVADNIAFGVKRPTPEQIREAAELVGADDFINELPEGYDTVVGEGGVTLSGGQRQRVCFARAVMRQSPVMILDEPATGLDVHAEASTKELLGRIRTDRTLVVITHRLHFMDLAEWVVLIEDGRVTCQGHPHELITTSAALRAFVNGGNGMSGAQAIEASRQQ